MSRTLLIGVDHGYSNMKSRNCCFPSGVIPQFHRPYTLQDVLEFDGKYYVTGSGRLPLLKDKTSTEDYYLLTLAALAREIEYRHEDRTAQIHLAAGLPLTSIDREKIPFYHYLLRDRKPVAFRFEDESYTLTITAVNLFPQGYAGAVLRNEYKDEPSILVADIGGWTVDVMRVDNKKPVKASFHSKEIGILRCMDNIKESVRSTLGLSPTTAQIESFMRSGISSLDDLARQIIYDEALRYARDVIAEITVGGQDIRAVPVVFMGGGASLIRRFLPLCESRMRFVVMDDIRLNAIGYEHMAHTVRRKAGNNV